MKLVHQYRNAKELQGEKELLNWLYTKLPEATGKRLQEVYQKKYRTHPNDIFKDNSAKDTVKNPP